MGSAQGFRFLLGRRTLVGKCALHGLSDPFTVVFLSLVAVHLVPVWAFLYFPSQDGPAHIENANILRHYSDPNASLLREYYVINRKPNPNWLGHLVLAGLMRVFSSRVAEKILLSCYVILLPTSILYAIRSIRPANVFLSVMAFPFIYSYHLHMGFYNFACSLPIYFFILGCWLRKRGLLTPRDTLTMSFLLVLLYFTHIVSLVMAVVALSVLASWSVFCEKIGGSREAGFEAGQDRGSFRRYGFPVLLALLPAILLALLFFRGNGVQVLDRWSVFDLSKHLLALSSLWSYERIELLLSSALVCVFAGASIPVFLFKLRERQFDDRDGLILVGLVYVLLYFLTPDRTHQGQYISSRLLLFPYFALLLWLGRGSFERAARIRVVVVTCGIAFLFLVLHVTKYAELNRYLKEYMSGVRMMEQNRTLLPLSFAHAGPAEDGQRPSERIRPFLFAAGYIAAERGIVELHNYEAMTDSFPLRYRPSLSPFLHIWMNKGLYLSPEVDFIDYAERTGGRVDYVLSWGCGEEMYGRETVDSILDQLARGYRLVFKSEQGWMKLYQSKGLDEANPRGCLRPEGTETIARVNR